MSRLSILLLLVFCLPAHSATATWDESKLEGLKWREIGPYRGGRSAAVTGIPSQPDVYYFGATGGGVLNRVLYETSPVLSDAFITTIYVVILGGLGFYALAIAATAAASLVDVTLRRNTQNTLLASAIDDLAPPPKPVTPDLHSSSRREALRNRNNSNLDLGHR